MLKDKIRVDFRFLQISTDEVYGSLGPSGKFSEASPVKPNSPYSASKAAGDHLARAWGHTYGLPVIVTNCSNNYGPRQHPEKLIPNMICAARSTVKSCPSMATAKMCATGSMSKTIANGVWLALDKGKSGECYDFGGDAEVENLTLVKRICDLLDRKKPKILRQLPRPDRFRHRPAGP